MKPELSSEELFEHRLKKLAVEFDFFAHVTSHDLRDPLRQARIYSDELVENLDGINKDSLVSINKLIDEVLEKISILRDYYYVANEKSIASPVDLNDLTSEVLKELEEKIKTSSAKIKIDKLPTVSGNAKNLKRLFLLLIDNAIKFHAHNINPKIEINAIAKKDFWHFKIIDNGIGLDKVYRELVFVLFQKLDNETNANGYGIGLAFAKKIVENHGGEIWYESEGDSGTIFHFTIKKI